MAWRLIELATALLLVVGVLGVSTALIGEVQDAIRDTDPPQPEIGLAPPDEDRPGLPLQAFTLLDPVPITLDGARFHYDTLTLPHTATLHLTQGDRIEPDPMPIPTPATARFPNGAQPHEGGITCPQGCTVDTANTPLPIPSGATLETPTPPTQDALPAKATLELDPGTTLVLDPLPATKDTQLPLLETTLIQLPPGTETPLPQEHGNQILPPGTHIQAPPGAGLENLPHLEDPDPTTAPHIPPMQTSQPNLTIQHAPKTVKKSTNHHVIGTLTLDDEPIPNQRITLTANATPNQDGYPINVGTVKTSPQGTFNATIKIPADAPAQPYYLIAQNIPNPDHDPPLAAATDHAHAPMEANTRVTLDAPTLEGLGLPFPLRVNLTDDHGAPVPGQPVRLDAQNSDWTTHARTNANGHALLIHEGLGEPGDWTLEGIFPGTRHLAPSTTTHDLTIVHERIETPATITAKRGDNATIPGQILHDTNTTTANITATLHDDATTTQTDPDGRFTFNLPIPPTHPIGNHTVTLETNTTTHTRTLILTVTGQPQLDPQPPRVLPQQATINLPIHATLENDDEPAKDLPIQAHTPHGTHHATTNEHGTATLPIPLRTEPLDVTIETTGTHATIPATTQLTLHPEPLTVDGTPTATRHTPHETTLQLAAGAPLAHEHIILTAPNIQHHARTNANGTATLNLQAPPEMDPGQHDATLHIPNLDLRHPIPLSILHEPNFNVTILNPGNDGDPIHLETHLTTPQGPLPNQPITAQTTGAFTTTTTAVTDEEGTAHLTLQRPSNADGETNITLTTEPTQHAASTTHTQTLHVTSAPFPWWALLIFTPLPLAAWILHRRRTSTPTRQPNPRPPNAPHITLHITHQNAPFPPVWHADDPIPLTVTLMGPDDEPLPNASLTLTGSNRTKRVQTGEDGTARLNLPPHPKGAHTYTARYDGSSTHPATETLLEFRIVTYREEIDREYEKLRRTAIQKGRVQPDATPHELANQLGATRPARHLARLFERCNYSNRPVTRTHYERFMKAKEACLRDALVPDGA